MLDCAAIENAIGDFHVCESTEMGTRFSTHCLYPSFEQVSVFIVGSGDGFIVHDGGGAARAAWVHGTDKNAFARSLTSSASAFGCEVRNGQVRIEIQDKEWLWSAISSVANASSDAARAAVGRIRVTKEENLIRRTKAILDGARWKPETKLDVVHPGRSGKLHTFDLSIKHGHALALIDAVVPHPNSIAAKYLAFSDTETRPGLYKYALYESDLGQENKALLQNVADLVSFKAIAGTDGRFLIQ